MYRQLLKPFLIVAISLWSLCSFGQFINDTKLLLDLRGKPKSCLTFSYNRITKSPGKLKLNSYTKVFFNEKGQVVERIYAGTVNYGNIEDEYKTTYKYDTKGNIAEMVMYDEKGKPASKFEFTYDASKGLFLQKHYDLTEIHMARVSYGFKVDASGRILDQLKYN